MTVDRWWKPRETMPVDVLVEAIVDRRSTPMLVKKVTYAKTSVGDIPVWKLVGAEGHDLCCNVLAWRPYVPKSVRFAEGGE